MSQSLIITHGSSPPPVDPGGREVLSAANLRECIRPRTLWKHVLRYHDAQLLAARADFLPRRLGWALVLRLLSHGRCAFTDSSESRREITLPTLARFAGRWAIDSLRRRTFLRQISREVRRLAGTRHDHVPRVNPAGRPVYLRTDLWFGVLSGGSVGHVAGVLNHLDAFCKPPIFLTTDRIPTARDDIETHLLQPGDAFLDFAELPELHFNRACDEQARRVIGHARPAFLYQRYSLNNYAGVKLARRYGVPLVLEFNGSEVWVSRHWGRRLRCEDLSAEIEDLNLRAADLVVVVSEPIRQELLERGVANERILVNPNGVDPARYHPGVDGSAVRRRYGLDGKTVIGFIGTFGRWHGAEVLAEAFGRLVAARPTDRGRLRLLLIGDGVRMPQVREQIARYAIEDCTVLTGLVPQAEGAAHLAACDILASPHVPNPDGTPFFGSPTKLFEYMAMGRGVVASDLDQIGEILEHGRTAWMVPPADPQALADGLRVLADDIVLCRRLGAAARDEAVAKHTWRDHARRIIEAIAQRIADHETAARHSTPEGRPPGVPI
ncbi:MAG TPA: glycosyltransferase family 4 protein [Planctomycetaceae bacterium]|nr:glycosyltransferase family 4 protein [Planctomycetaceae bacterium]